jgi:ABC-type branched-subunit amino acid transport system substrate-binding protein
MLARAILGVDFGTSNTVAVLGVPGRSTVRVMFDGSPVLPSGVYAEDRETLRTGRDAVQAAQTQPERYVAHPKLKVSHEDVRLGAVEVPALELVAAVLTRVWEEAVRTVELVLSGHQIAETIITYPDTWGQGRAEILLTAARQVGMVKPRLIKEPIAAAAHLVAKPQDLQDNRPMIIYDLGAGTFDASIVRKRKSALEVLESTGMTGSAGLALDDAIANYLSTLVIRTDPAAAERVGHPQTRADRRAAQQFLDTVRQARESLSTQRQVRISYPHHESDLTLTREKFEELARPILQTTVDDVINLISDAGLGKADIGPILLVGGASRTPLVTELLKETFHRSPIPMLDPEQAVAEGSIHGSTVKAPAKTNDVTPKPPRDPAPAPAPRQPKPPRRPASPRTTLRIAVAGLGVVAVTAGAVAIVRWHPWQSLGGSGRPSTTATPITNPVPGDDGVLRIAGLLPQTGRVAEVSEGIYAAYDLAIDDINDGGGILGQQVVPLRSDSTDDAGRAEAAVDVLLQNKADVLIGTTSSALSLAVIDKITGTGHMQISPANTAVRLSTVADNGLYFRTAPSDTFQGDVVKDLILRDGKHKTALFVRNDEYGRGLAAVIQVGLTKQNVAVLRADYAETDTDFSQEVAQIKSQAPDSIVMIGFDETKQLITELVKSGINTKNTSWYLVDGNFLDYSNAFAPGTLDGAKATQPGAPVSEEFKTRLLTIRSQLKNFPYSPETYDAVILAALAAQEARTDNPGEIAKHMLTVSRGGTKCTTFRDCKALVVAGGDIDYEGLSGPIDFDANGDVTAASIGIYQYVQNNTYKYLRHNPKVLS